MTKFWAVYLNDKRWGVIISEIFGRYGEQTDEKQPTMKWPAAFDDALSVSHIAII